MTSLVEVYRRFPTKDDARAFITAASKASQAVEYLRGLAITDQIKEAA